MPGSDTLDSTCHIWYMLKQEEYLMTYFVFQVRKTAILNSLVKIPTL